MSLEICAETFASSVISNIFTYYYPHVSIRACLLHYGQSLFRKFVDLGLKIIYKDDKKSS